MITLINPPGIKSFSGPQMPNTRNPKWFVGRVYIRRWRKLAESAHR